MDFSLTEQQKLVRDTVKEFAEKELLPQIQKYDEFACYNRAILSKMGELGILGICIPEQYGGSGYDYNCLAIACEELERVDTAARITLSIQLALSALTILRWGTEEQKYKYLIPQAKGQAFVAFASSESHSGTDLSNIKTTVVENDDHFILNGTKMWVSLVDVADYFIVIARTQPNKKAGLSCFIVDRNFPGVKTTNIDGSMNVRIGNTGSLILNNVIVPKENLLGYLGEGLKIALSAIDLARFTAAAGAVGITRACLDASILYARKRETFGEPIGHKQLIQQMIAQMVAGLETSQLLVHKAGWCLNKGYPSSKECSLAKWYACDVSFRSASDAMQIHAAYSYLNNSPLERYLRNAKGSEIYTGTREIQQIIQAEYAMGYRVDKPMRTKLPSWPFKDIMLEYKGKEG